MVIFNKLQLLLEILENCEMGGNDVNNRNGNTFSERKQIKYRQHDVRS